ncbi:hypothetical protein FRC08_012638 [Ceratobasidium sp. 394]|nr:hypothetical protein FRC08_012638 [Ceratobasidium sp. 394]
MGKWSPAYHDDLLHMKFRCLTYNAVDKLRRPKLEDDLTELNPEPRITHEQFIQASSVSPRAALVKAKLVWASSRLLMSQTPLRSG